MSKPEVDPNVAAAAADPALKPGAQPADPFKAAKAAAEKAGALAVQEVPTLIKGAVTALRVDH